MSKKQKLITSLADHHRKRGHQTSAFVEKIHDSNTKQANTRRNRSPRQKQYHSTPRQFLCEILVPRKQNLVSTSTVHVRLNKNSKLNYTYLEVKPWMEICKSRWPSSTNPSSLNPGGRKPTKNSARALWLLCKAN